jgi:hypothetical protein
MIRRADPSSPLVRPGRLQEYAAMRADLNGLRAEIRGLEQRIASVQEHGATKADIMDIQAFLTRGRPLIPWPKLAARRAASGSSLKFWDYCS